MTLHVCLFGTYNTDDTGPSRVTEGLARGLASTDCSVELLVHGDREQPPHEDVSIVQLGETPQSVVGFFNLYRKVRQHVHQVDPDVFHPLEDYPFGADVRTIQWAFTSIDLLCDGRFPGTNVPLRALLGEIPLYAASAYGAHRSERVVVQSPVTERQIQQYWRLSSDRIIPLGIDEDSCVTPNKQSNTPQVLFPGRITPKKGQARVLQHLDPNSDQYDVTLVGSVSDPDYVNQEWLAHSEGFVSRDRLNRFYENADIVVIGSYHETFAMTAIEAIARGCILVITEDCGFAQFEWANSNNGVYVVKSGKEAADMVRKLAGRELFSEQLSAYELAKTLKWTRIAEQYLDIYTQEIIS